MQSSHHGMHLSMYNGTTECSAGEGYNSNNNGADLGWIWRGQCREGGCTGITVVPPVEELQEEDPHREARGQGCGSSMQDSAGQCSQPAEGPGRGKVRDHLSRI